MVVKLLKLQQTYAKIYDQWNFNDLAIQLVMHNQLGR